MFGMTTTATETNQASDLDAASKQVEQATADLESWRQRATDLQNEIAHLTERSGTDALESGDVSGIARRLSEKRDELTIVQETIKAAERAVEAANSAYQRADAQTKRQEAQRLRKEADTIDGKAQKHLDALQEIQGVEYAPSQPPVGTASSRTIQVARSTALRNQASGLERQAAETERKLNRAV